MTEFILKRVIGFLVLVFVTFGAVPVMAETAVGSDVESRVLLAFNVDGEAAQGMLPEGWAPLTLPKGPLAGSNLFLGFNDRHLARDPEGNPLTPHNGRSLAVLVYGVKAGHEGARLFVTRVYETPPVASSYDNGVAAQIGREASLNGTGDGVRTHKEIWTVEPEGGGAVSLNLSYERGQPAWSIAEATPYSAVNPDFHRIYRYERLVDLAMSAAIGRELKGEISFNSSVPELSGLFDGNETLTGVLTIPVYVREVYLP